VIQDFLAELTAHYATHHLAPSLVLSRLGDHRHYAAVHTFPNGLNSRCIVAKHTADSLDEAVSTLIILWRAAVGAVA